MVLWFHYLSLACGAGVGLIQSANSHIDVDLLSALINSGKDSALEIVVGSVRTIDFGVAVHISDISDQGSSEPLFFGHSNLILEYAHAHASGKENGDKE